MNTTLSFLSGCPSTATMTFSELIFWTQGYGGWVGVCFLPMLWSFPVSKTLKCMLSILVPPTSALIMTAAFSAFYLFSVFLYHLTLVMIHPNFIYSCVGIVGLSLGSVGFFFSFNPFLTYQIKMDIEMAREDAEAEDAEAEEETEQEQEQDAEEETEESAHDENAEQQTDCDASSTDISVSQESPDNSWRERANFDGLRNAAPLPE